MSKQFIRELHEKKIIEPHIYYEKWTSQLTGIASESYVVRYSNKHLHTTLRFKTLDDARVYNETCKQYLAKFIVEKYLIKDYKNTEYPDNILSALDITDTEPNYYEYIQPNFEKNLEKIPLLPREKDYLLKLYKNYLTLEKIGKQDGITRERVRQIIAKAIRKLKNKKKVFIEEDKYDLISKEERDRIIEEIRQELKEQMTLEMAQEIVYGHSIREDDNSEGIESFNFSVRTYHCLIRAGIRTVDQLTKARLEDLMRIRNLGKKSLFEIKRKLEEIGVWIK